LQNGSENLKFWAPDNSYVRNLELRVGNSQLSVPLLAVLIHDATDERKNVHLSLCQYFLILFGTFMA